MSSKTAPHPRTLKILCFGDSLTAGYSAYGSQFYPYADHLKRALQATFPSSRIEIIVEGMSGAQVRGQYTGRLNRACERARDEPFDWIVVLGGTNDLGWGGQPKEIYEALQAVWNIALNTGANVLALTIIEASVNSGTLIERRDTLNALIAEHKVDRFHYMDLCHAIPYFTMEEKKRDTIWDDGLHLTAEGYKMMGDAIGLHMARLLPALDNVKNKQAVTSEKTDRD
ncbi:hypothetical protein MMC13_001182 [Lambiella insularis]|nr:hypothetical protein [Lambiella insularis]